MGNDELPLLEELVGYANAFAEQATGVTPQVQNQALQITERIERLGNLALGSFVEPVDVHVADARLDQEVYVDRVAGNLVANQRELHRLFHAFTRDADVDGSAL